MHYQVIAESLALYLSKISLIVLPLTMGLGVPGARLTHALSWGLAGLPAPVLLGHLFPFRRQIPASQRNIRELLAFSAPVCQSLIVQRLGEYPHLLLLGTISSLAALGIFSAVACVQTVGGGLANAASTVGKPMICGTLRSRRDFTVRQLMHDADGWGIVFTSAPLCCSGTLYGANPGYLWSWSSQWACQYLSS